MLFRRFPARPRRACSAAGSTSTLQVAGKEHRPPELAGGRCERPGRRRSLANPPTAGRDLACILSACGTDPFRDRKDVRFGIPSGSIPGRAPVQFRQPKLICPSIVTFRLTVINSFVIQGWSIPDTGIDPFQASGSVRYGIWKRSFSGSQSHPFEDQEQIRFGI